MDCTHTHTHTQLSYIGNFPLRNISDRIDLDSSKTYASSKAVYTLNNKLDTSLSNSNLPIGSILIFSGKFGGYRNRYPIDFTTGKPVYEWCLCDGETYGDSSFKIPNLRGRMIIGSSEEYPINSYGGNTDLNDVIIDSTSLTSSQNAVHIHAVTLNNSHRDCGYASGSPQFWLGYASKSTEASGKSLPHSHTISSQTKHLPPYYSLAYIIRVPKIEIPEITDNFISSINRLHLIMETTMPNCTSIKEVLE